jgi:alkaline phosphatase
MEDRDLALTTLMKRGMTGYAVPMSHETIVIDSAASATQLATGITTRTEMLGMDPDGSAVETLLEWAEERGLATGLVTNTRLTHATPAAFATHMISRYEPESDIADAMLAGSKIEVLMGGGARAFIPKGVRVSEILEGVPHDLDGSSRRSDERNLVEEARSAGYAVASDRETLKEAGRASKLLGLFAYSHLPYEVDRRNQRLDGVPSLKELTETALSVLRRNGEGFFLMVEGGRIDHAAHDNDAGTMLQEILAFDDAVDAGVRFQSEHPETLVIVTADHATGGFSWTYSLREETFELPLASGDVYRSRWYYPGKREMEMLAQQTASFESILKRSEMDVDRLIKEVEKGVGLALTREEAERVLARNEKGHAVPTDFAEFYADWESAAQAMLGRALARQTSVVWSTGGHTSDPLLTFGSGPGAEKLRGIYTGVHIHDVIKSALEGIVVSR